MIHHPCSFFFQNDPHPRTKILKNILNRGGVPLNFYEGGRGLKKFSVGVGSRKNFSVGVWGHFEKKIEQGWCTIEFVGRVVGV